MKKSTITLVKSNGSESGTLETLPAFDSLQIMEDQAFDDLKRELSVNPKVCIISESSIEYVLNCLPNDSPKKKAIEVFKDKFLFRNLVKSEVFHIQKVDLLDLTQLNIKHKSVIKPLKGCFGTAVKIVDSTTDLNKILVEIQEELTKNAAIFSDSVLSSNEFIVEDFIEGEEYAIDMFYNSQGKPCIVNIYHHPIPKNEAYLHMIYYSSKNTFEEIYPLAKGFFEKLNQSIQVTDFPMHCEFKRVGNELIPIEINPMRFGGMGLGNLTYYSFDVNPYQYFLEDIEPNWTGIMNNIDENARFVYLIAYNAASKDKKTHFPNVQKLRNQLGEIRLEKLFDYQNQLAFGVFCLRESAENLHKLLQIDFDDYFELK